MNYLYPINTHFNQFSKFFFYRRDFHSSRSRLLLWLFFTIGTWNILFTWTWNFYLYLCIITFYYTRHFQNIQINFYIQGAIAYLYRTQNIMISVILLYRYLKYIIHPNLKHIPILLYFSTHDILKIFWLIFSFWQLLPIYITNLFTPLFYVRYSIDEKS